MRYIAEYTYAAVYQIIREYVTHAAYPSAVGWHETIFENYLCNEKSIKQVLDRSEVSRWIQGTRRVHSEIRRHYAMPSAQDQMAYTIQTRIMPYVYDYRRLAQRLARLVESDDTLPLGMREHLASKYLCDTVEGYAKYIALVICYAMDRLPSDD